MNLKCSQNDTLTLLWSPFEQWAANSPILATICSHLGLQMVPLASPKYNTYNKSMFLDALLFASR